MTWRCESWEAEEDGKGLKKKEKNCLTSEKNLSPSVSKVRYNYSVKAHIVDENQSDMWYFPAYSFISEIEYEIS